MAASEFPDLIQRCEDWRPELGIVLGSGLGKLVERLDELDSVPYTDVEALTGSTVPGHNGRFVRAILDGVEIVVAQGRLHIYEGLDAKQVTATVRAIRTLGARTILLTNAAGCLNPDFKLGAFMAISDHLNLMPASPLSGPDFLDLTDAYDPALRQQLLATADVEIYEGVYACVRGPHFETPAEIRMLQTLGADAVGMSTVLETIQARSLGMRVAALSCLTNWGAGISAGALGHAEVVERGEAAVESLLKLTKSILPGVRSADC